MNMTEQRQASFIMVRRLVCQEKSRAVNIDVCVLNNIIEIEFGISQAVFSEFVKVTVKMIINNSLFRVSDYQDDMSVNKLGYSKSALKIVFVRIIIAEIPYHIDRVISRRLLIPDPDLFSCIFSYIFERAHVADQDVI